MASIALRAGVKPEALVKHLRGIRCHSPAWESGGAVLSCPDAIGIVLGRYLEDKAVRQASFFDFMPTVSANSGGEENGNPRKRGLDRLVNLAGACPECGGTVEHLEGCLVCRLCGFSRCS